MLDMDAILDEINRIENEPTSYQNCVRLSVLYSIVDHNQHNPLSYSASGSEFLNAVSGAPDIGYVMGVLDEHMCCIQLLHPKEYAKIIKMIKSGT